MKNSKLYIVVFLMLSMVFVGYECTSTELTSARLYMQQKNWDKAIESLNKELTKNPKSVEGYYLLGDVYRELGDVDKMLDNFDKSLSYGNKYEKDISNSKYSAWANAVNKGSALFQRTSNTTNEDSVQMYLDKAINELSTAVKIEPDSAVGYQYLAYAYLSKGNNDATDKAIEPLQKLISINNSKDGYKLLGQIYSTKGYNLKNQEKPDEAKAEYNKAIDILEKGLKVYPNDEDFLVGLSTAYVGAGRGDEALDKYKELAAAKPDDKNILYNYGVLLLGVEDFAGAEAQFKKAIDIDPDYDNAIYNLGVTYLKWGSYLNKKADEEGKVSDEYKTKYENALPYLEKAVKMADANAQTWELLGKVYSVLGKTDEATNAFNEADKLRK